MTIAIMSSLFVCSGLLSAPLAPVAASSMPADDARRREIFETLRGGNEALSGEVTAHLWKLAGSLSRTPWTPPATHVRVVVRKLDSGRRT
jgi:hypothetical protein